MATDWIIGGYRFRVKWSNSLSDIDTNIKDAGTNRLDIYNFRSTILQLENFWIAKLMIGITVNCGFTKDARGHPCL